MVKEFLGAIALTALLAGAPASAQTGEMMDCTDDNMTEASLAISMMTAGEKKNTAVKEMTMAREMLGKDDMAGCKTHLNNAIKIEKSK